MTGQFHSWVNAESERAHMFIEDGRSGRSYGKGTGLAREMVV